MSSESFADLGVSRPIVDALAKRGINQPFAVQRLAIADVLGGRDVLVQSPTGSGKTLAFGIPIVDRLERGAGNGAKSKSPGALILAPTRELAEQIVEETQEIARARGLKVAPVYGGVGLHAQAKRAAKADIVVATPGRLEDLLDRRHISIEAVEILVLDEADRMLDMGFKPPVDRIVKQIKGKRQTLFFSATLEGAVGKLASAYTRDPARHVHAPEGEKGLEIEHRFVHLRHDDKVDALVRELGEGEYSRTLVFVRTKRGADRLVKKLDRARVRAVAMHGNKSQPQRRRALASFEAGEIETLVATDVAARGIDVDDIDHVINFDAPEDREAYVHRTGRTARAGRAGAASTFVLSDQSREMRAIAHELGLQREFDADRPAGHGDGPQVSLRGRQGNGNGGRSNGNGSRRNGGRSNGGRPKKGTTKSYRPRKARRR